MSESDDSAEAVTDVSQLFPDAELSAPLFEASLLSTRTEPNLIDYLPPASVLCSVGGFVAVTGFMIFTSLWFDLQQSGIDGTTMAGKGLSRHAVSIRSLVNLCVGIGVAGIAVFVLGLVKRTTEDGEF